METTYISIHKMYQHLKQRICVQLKLLMLNLKVDQQT